MKKHLFSLCMMAFVTTALFAQADLQPLVTVKLNKTESITLKNLKARVATYQKQMGVTSFTVDQKKEILDALIDEKLILQAAAKAGMALTDTQVTELYLANLAQMAGQQVTEAQFASVVKQQTGLTLEEFFQQQAGMSVADYKLYLKNQYIAQQYIIQEKRSDLEKIAASDTEIRNFFEMNKASFVLPDTRKIFIVVSPKNNDANAAKSYLQGVNNEMRNGTLTVDTLQVRAAAEKDKLQAGVVYVGKNQQGAQGLGYSSEQILDMFSKADGYVSDLDETAAAYRFYVVLDRYDAKMLGLSDVVQPDSTTTVYEYIRAVLTQQKQQQYLVTTAMQEISETLRVDGNYQMLKTGDALNKLLENW